MTKFIIKLLLPTLRIMTILLLVFIAFIAGIGLFINLNNYKDQISSFISKSIGYEFNINGSIQWLFTNDITFTLQDVTIADSGRIKFTDNLLSAKEISIAINPISSLLQTKLIVSNIKLDKSKIHFVRNDQKKTNLDEFIQRARFIMARTNIKNKINLHKLALKDVEITINDQITNRNINVIKITANLVRNDHDVSIDLKSATIDLSSFNQQMPSLKEPFVLEGTGSLNLNDYSVNIINVQMDHQGIRHTLAGNIDYEDQKIVATGDLRLIPINNLSNIQDLSLNAKIAVKDQQINLNNIVITLDEGKIIGDAKLLEVNNVHVGEFSLKVNEIEVPKIILFIKDIQHNETNFLINLLKDVQLSGNIRGNNLYFNRSVVMENLDLPIKSSAPGVFEIDGGLFNLAKTVFRTTAKVDLNQKFTLNLSIDAKDVDMQAISRASMSGLGKVSINLSSIVNQYNDQELLKNLEGNVAIEISNGSLEGIDFLNTLIQYEKNLDYLFSILQMNVKQNLEELLNNSKKTVQNVFGKQAVSVFASLQFKAAIKNGVAPKAELFIKHPQYLAKGYGVIDLPQGTLDYGINAKLVKPPSDFQQVSQYMQASPLLIQATGPMQNINFSIDTQAYLLDALKALQKSLLNVKRIISGPLEESDPKTEKPAA